MVDTYNKSLNSDQNSEWNQEYGDFNDAWQKWVDDTSSRAKNEKQSFSNLQTALDKLTPLMSKNKGISQDFVKNSQDSWQKDKKKLGDTSNPDHDDYLAALSPEDFADYKAVLDYYDQYLNKDLNGTIIIKSLVGIIGKLRSKLGRSLVKRIELISIKMLNHN